MKKGFTLIELLATIVVLSIILVIAIPQVLKVIANSKKDSLAISAMQVVKAIERDVAINETEQTTIDCMDKYKVNTTDYESCTATVIYGENDLEISVHIVGKGKFKGLSVIATKDEYHVIDSDIAQSLKTALLATVNGKEVVIGSPGTENGLYKWGNKYIYRGGITKTNSSGLNTSGYASDVDSGNEVNNYIKVPWEDYSTYTDCTNDNNKCWRIIGINEDGSITIIRDKSITNQVFDNTPNSHYIIKPNTRGYNDLLANSYTTYANEYREYSLMYNYLYGSGGYQNTTIKPYSLILQTLNVCLNKADSYMGINNTPYDTSAYVTNTCDVTNKINIKEFQPLENQYVRLLYTEEYLNASLESTCKYDQEYQCRNRNYLYNKTNYWSINGNGTDNWGVRCIENNGRATNRDANNNYGIRPVVILKPSVLISGGSGTKSEPYVINW